MIFIIKKEVEARTVAEALKKEHESEVVEIFKKETVPTPPPMGFRPA